MSHGRNYEVSVFIYLLMICTASPKFAIGKASVLEQLLLKRTLDIHFLIYKLRIMI